MKRTRLEINRFGGLVGASPDMTMIFEMVERAAEVNVPVLIVGETGTGKELVAREIHSRSGRHHGPFVAVNTGALSEELVASELFGHVKGAFTGAVGAHDGRFSEAEQGSLFLDEIATMSERIQVVFLRVLEDGVYRPVGATQDKMSDVRLLAATNADLRQAVETGQFREDLLQRLTVFRINLPALREHIQDLPMLAYHFLDLAAAELSLDTMTISDDALEALSKYSWPGNIRELKNAIAQSAIMARGDIVQLEHIPPRITTPSSDSQETGASDVYELSSQTSELVTAAFVESQPAAVAAPDRNQDSFVCPVGLRMDEVQRAYVAKTLAACSNNKTHAAKILGISRKTLRDWLRRWANTYRET